MAVILNELGINGDEREALVDLARQTDGPHWLGVGMPALERQLNALLEFERTATHIVDVSPLLIPGLLQTADYVRAMMTTGGVPASEIETRIATRIGRRETLLRRDPTHLDAYIGEAALRQTLGGSEVMAEQLQHLLVMADRSNVDLRIIPLTCDWNPALEGPFVLVEVAKATPIVHLENRRSGLFLHEQPDVAAYREAADRVRVAAMSPEESVGLIAKTVNAAQE